MLGFAALTPTYVLKDANDLILQISNFINAEKPRFNGAFRRSNLS